MTPIHTSQDRIHTSQSRIHPSLGRLRAALERGSPVWRNPLLLYTLAFALSALAARYLLHYAAHPSYSMLIVFCSGALVLHISRQRLGWSGAWCAICIALVAILASGVFHFKQYGDAAFYQAWVGQGVVHNRWMLGMALENELYATLKSAAVFFPQLRGSAIDAALFCQFVSLAAMGSATLYLLNKFSERAAIVLCLITPIWLTLTAGYIEYYPLIAALLPCFLAHILYREETAATYWSAGFTAAILAAAYVGFIPIAAIICGYFWLRKPANFIIIFLAAFGGFAILTKLFYDSPSHYLSSLPASMNLGNINSIAQYKGLAAADNSVFFKADYALSLTHLKEMARMYFVAGGIVNLPMLLYLAIRNYKALPRLLFRGHNLLLTLIAAWLWIYFIFMIPKLGPIQDVDLFFATYIVTAFWLGHWLDALPNIDKSAIFGVVLGNAALSFYLLSIVGIDRFVQ
jgi:hypothetical protein